MKHPIYRNSDANVIREKVTKSVKNGTLDSDIVKVTKSIKDVLGDSYKNVEQRVKGSHSISLIEIAVQKNGHVFIDASSEDWSSKISKKTIENMKIEDIKLPFIAGTVKIEELYVSYLKGDDKFEIGFFDDSGSYYIYVDLKSTIAEQRDNISNIDVLLDTLSALMYISLFKSNSERITASKTLPNKGSKKRKIPNHNTIYFKVVPNKINYINCDGEKQVRNKSKKTWIVRGHWRNQKYSKEGITKPKWIDSYFKGDGKEEVEKTYKI